MGKTKRTVLVTGGAGFIGSHLVEELIEKGYSTIVFDNLSSGKLENLNKVKNHPNFKFIKGDIRDKNALHQALQNIDAVAHLAALIDVSASVLDPTETHEINVTGTVNVLQEATKNKAKRLVFASSTAVYGDTKTLPVKETAPLKPISPYAASKAAAEAYCSAFANCYGIETIALRFFNVYGDRNSNSAYSGVITKFIQKAQNNQPLTIEGDGEQTRDFIHVNDVAHALTLALTNENTQPKLKGEAFNICTGTPTSINQLAETLKKATGKNLQTLHAPPRTGDIKKSYGDPTKAANKLGFKSKITLQKGLEKLITT